MRITIDHEPLRGTTPAMLLWWFQHINVEEVGVLEHLLPGLVPSEVA